MQLGAFQQETNAEALAGRTAALLAFLDADALSAGVSARREATARSTGSWSAAVIGPTAQALARELERVLERPTTLLLR